ncbi:MAG: hypothetical protein HYX53_02680 [Chloroflexi bacterium]|nr:hypothetical protein [Chloroflexota bacterium]
MVSHLRPLAANHTVLAEVSTIAWLIAGWLAAFVVNFVPAFMPPSAAVLAAFHIGAGVPLLPLTLPGAVAAALGRTLLALSTRRMMRYVPAADRKNAEAIGAWFGRCRRWRWPLVALYFAGPFPSNVLFIAAGAGRVPLMPLALTFALTRAVSDTFWVWTGSVASRNAHSLARGAFTDWRALVLQLVGVVAVVLVFRLPWARWLGIED